MAIQTLASSSNPRSLWLQILIELGSTSLNISAELVSLLVSTVSQACGPRIAESSMRQSHVLLDSPEFAKRLLDRLDEKLDSIAGSSSEVHCLGVLLDIALRIWSLCSDPQLKARAIGFLKKLRSQTFVWIRLSQEELHDSQDLLVTKRVSHNSVITALHCRRTFWIHESSGDLDAEAVKQLTAASLALQKNMDNDLDGLSTRMNAMLTTDLKSMYRQRAIWMQAILDHKDAFLQAFNSVYLEDFDGYECTNAGNVNDQWMWLNLTSKDGHSNSTVSFDVTQGHVYMQSRPISKLPPELRSHPLLTDLFGSRNLDVWPYPHKGFTFKVSIRLLPHHLWQPRDHGKRDLSGPLIDGCTHWLNRQKQQVEIRRGDPWRKKRNTWILDLRTNHVMGPDRMLLDPHSRAYRRMTSVLASLEREQYMIIWCSTKPQRRNILAADLPRMQLHWTVNKHNQLQCYQLAMETSDIQDSRTLYGLKHQLLLRDVQNPDCESIVVPFGRVQIDHQTREVVVDIDGTGFATFKIDKVLGRLTCALEPRLLYYKALLHAMTSQTVPDPLTQRTGVDEAIYWLSAGCSMPWTSLGRAPRELLRQIAELSPRSEWYPPNLRKVRHDRYSRFLPFAAQDPRFRPLVNRLLNRSDKLLTFQSSPEVQAVLDASIEEQGECTTKDDEHLIRRMLVRNERHSTPGFDGREFDPSNHNYTPRDRLTPHQVQCHKVAHLIGLIIHWPQPMETFVDLLGTFEQMSRKSDVIAGLSKASDFMLLSPYIETDLMDQIGPLICWARTLSSDDKFQMGFSFGLLAFNVSMSIPALHVLLGLAMWPDVKAIDPPACLSYQSFSRVIVPDEQYLSEMTIPYRHQYQRNHDLDVQYLSYKQQKALKNAENEHNRKAEMQSLTLIKSLLISWPRDLPSSGYLNLQDYDLLDAQRAIDGIASVWKYKLIPHYELTSYLTKVQAALSSHTLLEDVFSAKSSATKQLEGGTILYPEVSRQAKLYPGIRELVERKISIKRAIQVESVPDVKSEQFQDRALIGRPISELEQILKTVSKSKLKTVVDYATDLSQSLHSLKARKAVNEKCILVPGEMPELISMTEQQVIAEFDNILSSLAHKDHAWRWLDHGRLLPVLPRASLLQALRQFPGNAMIFGEGTRHNIIAYAQSIARLQRLQRVHDAFLRRNHNRLQDELENLDSVHYDADVYPHWLLFELDNDLTCRSAQIDLAKATVSPQDNENSLQQLVMGAGKASCVIPLSVLDLTTGSNLVRIIVPRALVLQTAQLLQARIGILNGKQIMHIPFTRRTVTQPQQIQLYQQLHEYIIAGAGCVVTAPEHVLSFGLSGVQATMDGRMQSAKELV